MTEMTTRVGFTLGPVGPYFGRVQLERSSSYEVRYFGEAMGHWWAEWRWRVEGVLIPARDEALLLLAHWAQGAVSVPVEMWPVDALTQEAVPNASPMFSRAELRDPVEWTSDMAARLVKAGEGRWVDVVGVGPLRSRREMP